MGYRDYAPGYRGAPDERDFERGRFGDRGEQERYGAYGRERYDAPYNREVPGRWTTGGYEEGLRNRDFDPGRWGSLREREYSVIEGEPGNFGPAANRFRDAGSRDRFEERGLGEGRGFERRGEFGVMGGSSGSWRYGGQPAYPESLGYGSSAGARGIPVSYAGRGPRGYRRADDAIRDEINERLTRHPEIDATDVEVRVDGAEVVLTGVVEDRRAKRLAEDICEDVWGVDDVRNELKVRHGFLARLTGEQADEREIARTVSRESTGTTGTTTSETARRTGRTSATAGSGAGSTSGT
jgi:hypothetical protein